MNMEERIMNDNVYDLFAVVLHTGTLNGGHYTASRRTRRVGMNSTMIKSLS